MRTLAAVDLGAHSGRVAVGEFDGARLHVEEVHRFPNVPTRVRGTLHWDVLDLYSEVLNGLRAAGRERAIESIGVDTWAVDFGLIDRAGRLVQNPVHYRDSRRAASVDAVHARISSRELYDRTGIQFLPINTIFELAAMAGEADPALEAATRLLLVPDIFNYWLCGAQTSERTNATTTQCFDIRRGTWTRDLLERLDVPVRLLPEVVEPATPLGPLTDEVAAETGIDGATIVATATHDTASAVVGTPLVNERSVFLSVGTWSLVGVEAHEPSLDEAAYQANLTNEGGVEGTFRVLRNVTGLWLLEECRRAWASSGRDRPLGEWMAAASSSPGLRALIDPNDPVFGAPGDMPGRIAEYCARTGQKQPDSEGAVVRCILESLALAHAEEVDMLGDATGRTFEWLHIVGGGAHNGLLCSWTASAAGLPVLAGPVEATLAGNLLVQALALGELGSLAEAREVARQSFETARYEPTSDPEWQEARERFAHLVSSRDALGACA